MIFMKKIWPTYRHNFLASMIRETINQIGVALIFSKVGAFASKNASIEVSKL